MSRSEEVPEPPTLQALWRMVKLGYRSEPGLLGAALLMTVFTAIPEALVALWLKVLADGVTGDSRSQILLAALGLAASGIGTWYLRVVFDRVQRRFRDKVGIALEAHVARLQASVATIEHHERPEYLDRLAVLRNQVFTLDHLFMSLLSTIGLILRLVFTVIVLMTIHPALVALLLFALPLVVVAAWRPGIERAIEEKVEPHNRLARHLFELGASPAPGKELRVTGNSDRIVAHRRESWEQWYAPVASAKWVTALWHMVAWALFGLAYVGAIVFVTVGLDSDVGAVVLVLVAGAQVSWFVSAAVVEVGFLRGVWLDSSKRLGWLEDYSIAMASTAEADVPDRLNDGIRFDGVTFTYPGTDRVVVDNIDLHLPAGKVIAIVGENGAGKTTLVKLMSRMYDPDEGRILIDGIDLRTVPHADWRRRMAGAFQDFFRFELRAATSIGIGDEDRVDDRPAVASAVGRAGADDVVDKLAYGLDTQLGPTWDEGVEVSFGQWQKLALARGFMRDDPLLLILDEPTAALDAETEHALFERFAEAARSGADPDGQPTEVGETAGRVTVLVSHRFSTVRMADLIVVLDGARVAEIGSHEELMANAGPYAALYDIQAAAYR